MNDRTQCYNRDCLEAMKEFPDKFFELAICDVPYGINHAEKAGKMAGQQYGNAAAKKRDYIGKDWDKTIPEGDYFVELKRISVNQIMWGGNYLTAFLDPSPAWIVWDKDNGENNFSDCELAWTSFKTGLRMFKCTWNGMIQYDMKNKEDRFHPTQKPIKLYKWILKNYAKEGDKILDTHGGSMSSVIACLDMGFPITCYELDKDYYNLAKLRINNHLNQLNAFRPPYEIEFYDNNGVPELRNQSTIYHP